MRVRFLAAASKEFSNAVSYYDSQKEGLGDEFADEVWTTISRIVRHPLAWQPLSARTRRCLTKRFPYGVILPGEVRFNPDHSRDASAPTSRELARPGRR
jgi:hypothetical protein